MSGFPSAFQGGQKAEGSLSRQGSEETSKWPGAGLFPRALHLAIGGLLYLYLCSSYLAQNVISHGRCCSSRQLHFHPFCHFPLPFPLSIVCVFWGKLINRRNSIWKVAWAGQAGDPLKSDNTNRQLPTTNNQQPNNEQPETNNQQSVTRAISVWQSKGRNKLPVVTVFHGHWSRQEKGGLYMGLRGVWHTCHW